MNPAVDNVLQRSLITLGLQNRNSRRCLFPISTRSLLTNGLAPARARAESDATADTLEKLPAFHPLKLRRERN